MVKQLGAFPLPVEILPFGHGHLLKLFKEQNLNPELRKDGKGIYLTEGGHYLADLHLGKIEDAYLLGAQLNEIPGVMEHGLFLDTVNKVVRAEKGNVEVITFR